MIYSWFNPLAQCAPDILDELEAGDRFTIVRHNGQHFWGILRLVGGVDAFAALPDPQAWHAGRVTTMELADSDGAVDERWGEFLQVLEPGPGVGVRDARRAMREPPPESEDAEDRWSDLMDRMSGR